MEIPSSRHLYDLSRTRLLVLGNGNFGKVSSIIINNFFQENDSKNSTLNYTTIMISMYTF